MTAQQIAQVLDLYPADRRYLVKTFAGFSYAGVVAVNAQTSLVTMVRVNHSPVFFGADALESMEPL